MSDAIDWDTIMSAIRAWIVGATGLPDNQVYWKYGKMARQPSPSIELCITDVEPIAHDYITKDFIPGNPNGSQLKRTAKGIRECTLEMQCFAPEGSVHQASKVLSNATGALALYTQPLNIAGVGMSDLGVATMTSGVKILEGRRGSILEPRAISQMSFYVNSAMSDFTTYIETVQVAIKPQNVDGSALPEIDEVISL
jgi:hypothetical protein